MTAHIAPNYTRYNTRYGYNVYAAGLPTFFAKTITIAKEWCQAHGFDWMRI